MRLLPWAPMFAAPALALAAYAFALGALFASQRDERRGCALRTAMRDVEMDAALAMDEAPPPPRAQPGGGEEASRATADARVEAAVRRAAAAEARAAEAEAAAEAYLLAARARRRSSSRGEAACEDDNDDASDDYAYRITAARDARLDTRSATDSDDGWERMSSQAAAASCVRCGDDASRGGRHFAAVPCGHWPLCAACAQQLDACAVCGQAVTLALLLRD